MSERSSPTDTRAGGGGDDPSCRAGTVRPGAKALITAGDDVLLVRERHGDGRPFWTLPGGGVRPQESFRGCLRREMNEELRCDVRLDGLAGYCYYDHRTSPATSFYLVFRGRTCSEPVPNPHEGIVDAAWTPVDSLPEGLLSPIRSVLAEACEGCASPD